MRIAILSDTHDHIENLERVISKIKEEGCEAIIFCGDFSSPLTARKLKQTNLPIYAVFGNTDGAIQEIVEMEDDKFKVFKIFGEFELDNKKIAICHYPQIAEGLAATGKYDIVFHGHTHSARKEKIGDTIIVNPGEVAGLINKPTFAIFDTETNNVEIINIGE